MVDYESVLVKTDVTAVKIVNDFILVGIGGKLHVYNNSLNFVRCFHIFSGQKLFDIVPDTAFNTLILFGENRLRVVKVFLHNDIFLHDQALHFDNEWLLTAKWLDSDSKIVTLSMSNNVSLWTPGMQLIRKVNCTESCMIYSAALVNSTWNELIVMSGTVFYEILLWMPQKYETLEFGPVLHRLRGHKGSIFSIDYSERLGIICSTSDDRSARIWSIRSGNLLTELKQPCPKITFKCLLYGHSARVFCCKILSNCIVTAGEDSFINIWNLDGKLNRKIEAHQGGAIWVIDCNEKDNIIASGGTDSGVSLFSIQEKVTLKEIKLNDGHVPRKIGILLSNNVVVITESGSLRYFQVVENTWHLIQQHDYLKTYVLLEISKCRKLVALAGFHGTIDIYKDNSKGLDHLVSYQTEEKSRIFSFHWLSCRNFLTCISDGILSLWNYEKNRIMFLTNLQLPPSKERWTTAACLCGKKYLAVGDRKGNIHLYTVLQKEPVQTIKKAHNHLGVTNLYYTKNGIISLGRNSLIKTFKFNNQNQQLSVQSSDKLPFAWLAALHEDSSNVLLLAFSGNNFVIWDYKTRRTVWEITCGGGHRSWNFNKNSNICSYVYIKDKILNLYQCDWTSIRQTNLVDGFHATEINSAVVITSLRAPKQYLMVTGSEDTTLRMSVVDLDGVAVTFTTVRVFKSHLSSIRCTALCQYGEGEEYLLFTGGGRAHIILWRLTVYLSSDIKFSCREEDSYYDPRSTKESETRVMDLCIKETELGIYLMAACSDGVIKTFLVVMQEDSLKYKMHPIGNVSYHLRCILKISYLRVLENDLILSMATDGKVVFWNFTDILVGATKENVPRKRNKKLPLKPFHAIDQHQSGINSFAVKLLQDSTYAFLSGGDDNAIVLQLIRFEVQDDNLNVIPLSVYRNVSAHCAQITGAFITDDYFITASIDHKVIMHEWKVINDELTSQCLAENTTCIPDIQGLQCVQRNNNFDVFVYGKGTELLKLIVT